MGSLTLIELLGKKITRQTMGASWCTNDNTIVVVNAENFYELLVSGGNEIYFPFTYKKKKKEIYFPLLFLEEKNII
jgi:hypothetical protein